MPALDSPLATIRDQLDQVARDVHALVQGRTPDDLAHRGDPARWSIAEHIEHMSLTTVAYLPLLATAARDLRARDQRSDKPLRADWKGRLLAWMLEPPVRMRTKTAAAFVPELAFDRTRVVERFEELQRRLAASLEDLEGLALDRHRIASPFDARIRYNAWAALRILTAHQRRHVWLAQRVRGAAARG